MSGARPGRASALPIVVVGGSVAGVRVAQALREGRYRGEIVVLDAEDGDPYDKPCLSKELLTAEGEPQPTPLTAAGGLAALGVVHLRGARATGLDLRRREVTVAGAAPVRFGRLVIATGSVPRRLHSIDEFAGVHYLRTLADAQSVRAAFAGRPRVAVIGGGFIGAEVAASARARDLDATLLEAAPRMLARLLPAEVSAEIEALHRKHGVDVRCGASVRRAVGTNCGRVAGLELNDGRTVEADLVVVGIGTTPATDWLQGSGLQVDDGVLCDSTLAVQGTEGVYAAGDVARWLDPVARRYERAEHWTAAREHAATVAHNLLHPASPRAYTSVPYVWSGQHGVRIQHVGRAGSGEIRRTATARGAVFEYLEGGLVVGATGLDAPREVVGVRRNLARTTAHTG
jgi:3-phenylpropionate/trans-cinnamate dioxygenase ferredoxin reductase component